MIITRFGRWGVFLPTLLVAAMACSSESSSDGTGTGGVGICADVEALQNQINETLQCLNGGEVLGDMCRRGLLSRPGCRGQVLALYDCVKDKPITDWSCHEVGQYPGLTTDACSAEDSAIDACFSG
jgi:hypothetical protein